MGLSCTPGTVDEFLMLGARRSERDRPGSPAHPVRRYGPRLRTPREPGSEFASIMKDDGPIDYSTNLDKYLADAIVARTRNELTAVPKDFR